VKEATLQIQNQIIKYQNNFSTLEDDVSYVKIINLRSKIICNGIYGHLPSIITTYLMSIHIDIRPVWLMTPAQITGENLENGDDFIPDGDKFRKMLPQFIEKRIPTKKDSLIVFTTPNKQYSKTVEFLTASKKIETPVLNPLNAGSCMGMSKAEISEKMPDVWKNWKQDSFHFRFPNGESYADLVQRLDPFVLQLERFTVPVLVVVHESVLQVLYCYFKNIPIEQSPLLRLPKHTVIELASTRNGWTEKAYPLAKDTTQRETL